MAMNARKAIPFGALILWALPLAPIRLEACWTEPEVVLSVPYTEADLRDFMGVSSDGAYVFRLRSFRPSTGTPQSVTASRLPFLDSAPYSWRWVTSFGFPLNRCCRTASTSVQGCNGELVRLLEPVGDGFYCALPGGGFLLKERHESPGRQVDRDSFDEPTVEYRRYRYFEFDCDGNYVKEWAKPPSNFAVCDSRQYKFIPEVVFPDKKYVYEQQSFKDFELGGIHKVVPTSFGCVTKHYSRFTAFGHHGELLCYRQTGFLDSQGMPSEGFFADQTFAALVSQLMLKSLSVNYLP